MNTLAFVNANLVLSHSVLENATLIAKDGLILATGQHLKIPDDALRIDLHGQYLAPGFVDVHVHGGAGADFMDLSAEAFHTVCQCHARHGTTSLTPTSTVSTLDNCFRFLELCDELFECTKGARNLGGHLYGPYFARNAKGCHPNLDFLDPAPENWQPFLKYAGKGLKTLTVAPELPRMQELIQACVQTGVRVNVGHSHATLEQVEVAVGAGATHVDHLFCAMSDRARLRITQAFPMRAGVLEATLSDDRLTTEVISDGWHLAESLLKVAWKLKGPDRLCLVTDSMRAVDCPDGEYWFGPKGTGELIRKRGEVGVTLDGTGLASGVTGMDHAVKVFKRATGAPVYDVIRCVTATPAKTIGLQAKVGTFTNGAFADAVVLDDDLNVKQVWIGGQQFR